MVEGEREREGKRERGAKEAARGERGGEGEGETGGGGSGSGAKDIAHTLRCARSSMPRSSSLTPSMFVTASVLPVICMPGHGDMDTHMSGWCSQDAALQWPLPTPRRLPRSTRTRACACTVPELQEPSNKG